MNRGDYFRKLCGICILLICAALLSGAACAESEAQRTVRVAFPAQGEMGAVGESGELLGYNADFLSVLAQYAGWKLEYITFDDMSSNDAITSAMNMIMSGEADLLGPVLKSDAVEEIFDFPKYNYGVVYTTLCALDNNAISSVNYAQCSPLRVAVYSGAQSRNQEVCSFLDQQQLDYEIIECESTEAQLDCLMRGDADVLSSITLSYFQGTKSVAEFAPRPYYFVTTKGNSELMQEMDAAIETLNYTLPNLQDQLQREYFGDTSAGYILSDSERDFFQNMTTLRVLCIPNYAPYASRGEDGRPQGVLVSLLNDFALENNFEIEYTFCDSAYSVEEEWASGSYDCFIGLPLSPEYCAAHGMVQSESVLWSSLGIVSRQQNTPPYAESSVAYYGQQAQQLDLAAFSEAYACEHPDDSLLAVENGDVDYGYVDSLSFEYMNVEYDWSLVFTPMLNKNQDTHINVARILDSCFLSALNKYIHTLQDSTTTTYLSEATRHSYSDDLMSYIQDNPLRASLILTAIGILLLSSVVFFIAARKNRRRSMELLRANAAMQQANAAKSEFLSRMSHDIRTPMNAILGFAELGKQDMDRPEQLAQDLNRISTSGEFLLGLVNDVLDMSKIESNAMELKPQPYQLSDFVNQIETLVSPLCADKRIDFSIRLADDLPKCLNVDRLRLNQIFFNLLSNAVKFTPEQGKVSLSLEVVSRDARLVRLRFAVCDNGIGISEEFQKRMFESFSQEHQHISGREGSGLGLAIVKSIVQLMGGSVSAVSRLGEGSCFTVELPLELCETPAEPQRQADGTCAGDSLKGRHVLLCEDHPINTQLACRLLEKAGVRVSCAANGQEGVKLFGDSAEGEFDAILMDIRMPVMDGMEATKAIRALQRADAALVPIIAMTANTFDEDVQSCRAIGMNAHLAKPFNVDALYRTLAEQIGNRNR